jgi:galactokinase
MPESLPESQIVEEVQTSFRESVPGSSPVLCFAPGRVNLLGAHLDYNGGDVLPVAVDKGIYVAAALRSDGKISARSLNQEVLFECDESDVTAFSGSELGWAAYPVGVMLAFKEKGAGSGGVDLVFAGDLPMAAGLSSSAAIELATACALNELYQSKLSRVELADLAHRAETQFVGLECGIMDQYASALSTGGQALFLHCRDSSFEHVPIDSDEVEILVMDSLKRRKLSNTGFNERVRECGRALEVFQREREHRQFLCDYDRGDLDAVADKLDPIARMRARHVIFEMERVRSGVQSLRSGDLSKLGSAIDASHRSTAIDYEVSCDELDELTGSASSHAAVFGSRLTGAGFGGCAIALVERGCTDEVATAVSSGFSSRFGHAPDFYVLKSGPGLRRIR